MVCSSPGGTRVLLPPCGNKRAARVSRVSPSQCTPWARRGQRFETSCCARASRRISAGVAPLSLAL